MSLRLRLTLFIAAVVALTAALLSWAAFTSASSEARQEIDDALTSRALMARGFRGTDIPQGLEPPADFRLGPISFESDTRVQVIDSSGEILLGLPDFSLPVEDADIAVAAQPSRTILRDIEVDGVHYRMMTTSAGDGLAIQMARDMSETDAFLADLRWRLIAIGGGGVLVAALISWFIARRALTPVGRLTDVIEHVATTQDLTTPIDVDQSDEIGRLATSFNTMLKALATSKDQQRRLVADAGHELRTPLTSLRTNIEVLARSDHMDPDQRAELLSDATGELAELSSLVAELVDLAGDTSVDDPPEKLPLNEVVAEAVARFSRRTGRSVTVAADQAEIEGQRDRLLRAVSNLLDNADKWSPKETTIEITVERGRVAVRDHGSGIDDSDLPHVFDRFYRASSARSMPGSGLGLSIVDQVAREHGGRAFAEAADEGGAIVGFEIPPV